MKNLNKIKKLLNEYHKLCQEKFKDVHENEKLNDLAHTLVQFIPELVEEIESVYQEILEIIYDEQEN